MSPQPANSLNPSPTRQQPHTHAESCSPAKPLAAWERTARKGVVLALGAFALLANPTSFACWTLAGFGIRTVHLWWNPKAAAACSDALMGCSRGFMETFTGVQLPARVSQAIDVAVMWSHIDHCPGIFVPITALYNGVLIKEMLG